MICLGAFTPLPCAHEFSPADRRRQSPALLPGPAFPLEKVSRNPYLGAIVLDDDSGRVLFEDNADGRGYPASVTKLMTFLVVMDKVKAGQLTLETPVTVSAEASRTGGSQVYLKQGEVFTVDELLYALMIQSANDAAVALAVHTAGSKEAFVELMNAKARQLGMAHTSFQSPARPAPGQGAAGRPDHGAGPGHAGPRTHRPRRHSPLFVGEGAHPAGQQRQPVRK